MNDEQEKLAPPNDESRIDIRDPWQVLWWCRNLGITKTQLEGAIHAVGNESVHVIDYIRARHERKKTP